jgi:hypothetical protein
MIQEHPRGMTQAPEPDDTGAPPDDSGVVRLRIVYDSGGMTQALSQKNHAGNA